MGARSPVATLNQLSNLAGEVSLLGDALQMKNALALSIVSLTSLAISNAALPRMSATQTMKAGVNRKPVVVELFTSEGCSSCPPADALLKRLETDQPIQGAEIIGFEEHVDYWNHDGWFDPYSSPEWTFRQQEYVARLKGNGPYTPQMVVDGQVQFVGSREREADEAIRQAALRPKLDVIVTADPPTNGIEHFHVRVGKRAVGVDRDTAEVWLVVTETGLESAVNAGENAGRDLHHAAVLRSLRKIGVLAPSSDPVFVANPQVKLKSNWKRQNLRIDVFVQERKSLRVLGAAWVGVVP
jgi:hypothetical protein